MPAGPTSRREFLRRAAALAGGAAVAGTGLAACAGKTMPNRAGPPYPVATRGTTAGPAATTPGTTPHPRASSVRATGDVPATPGGLLRIDNRPGSIGPDTVQDFQLATGVTVDYYQDIADDQTWLASVEHEWSQRNDIGADLVVLGDAAVGDLIGRGRLVELDQANVPNRRNLRPELRAPGFDPKRRHSLPWVAGLAGLAYDPALTLRPLTGASDLFDPAFKGRVTMLADLRDGLGMVMLSQGNSPARPTLAAVNQAVAAVGQARLSGQVARFTGNADFADLVSGAMAVAQVRSGDVAGLQAANPRLQFVVPNTGTTLFARDLVVPDTTHNQVAAEAWMNWIYDRSTYAQLIAAVRATVVLSDMTPALAAISPALATDPLINPPTTTWDRAVVWGALSSATEARYEAAYRQVTG